MPVGAGEIANMITLAEPIDLDTLRIRHEYLTAAELRLSADAAATLLRVSQRHALLALQSLVTERFLVRLPDGCYSRRSETPASSR
jgi:hypothetical protein